MATKKVCDICGKEIDVWKKTRLKLTPYKYKLLVDADYTPYYREYDLCYDCAMKLQKFLRNEIDIPEEEKR